MASTILQSPIFSEVILPFILVFVLIFAILEKTKILGEGKKQVDSLVALAIALITVSFGFATNVISRLTPFIAVAVVIILAFLLLVGFISGGNEGFAVPNGLKIALGILAGIALIIAVLWATGALDYLVNSLFKGENSRALFSNILFFVVITAVIIIALTSTKHGKES